MSVEYFPSEENCDMNILKFKREIFKKKRKSKIQRLREEV